MDMIDFHVNSTYCWFCSYSCSCWSSFFLFSCFYCCCCCCGGGGGGGGGGGRGGRGGLFIIITPHPSPTAATDQVASRFRLLCLRRATTARLFLWSCWGRRGQGRGSHKDPEPRTGKASEVPLVFFLGGRKNPQGWKERRKKHPGIVLNLVGICYVDATIYSTNPIFFFL